MYFEFLSWEMNHSSDVKNDEFLYKTHNMAASDGHFFCLRVWKVV